MSENTKVQPPPEVQDTRIITLLESNDVSFSPVDGQWSNNLNENTILKEGDSLTVRQSMIDTTSESIGLIDVKSEDSVITIQHGIYSVDAGDGSSANVLRGTGATQGQLEGIGTFQQFSDAKQNHPSGDKYILQNQSASIANTKIYYYAGAGNSGVGDTINPPNPDSVPTSDFNIEMVPNTGGGLFEYTIKTTAAAWVAPAGASPLPVPGNGTTAPIIKPENLEGLQVILSHTHSSQGQAEVIWKLYYHNFTPSSGTIDPDKDHFASIETIYEPDVKNSAAGYQSTNNVNFDPTRGSTPPVYNELWVFRTATFPGGGGSAYQYWSNKDTSGKKSPVFRVLNGFRMIVDDFSDFRDSKNRTNAPYQTQLTYTNHLGTREPVAINFVDWGNANEQVFGLVPANPGLFKQNEVYGPTFDLPDLGTAKGRKQAGWGGFSGDFFHWIQFTQLRDGKRPNHITLPPFVFEVSAGVEAFTFSGDRKTSYFNEGQAMGIYNPNQSDDSGSVKFLQREQMDTSQLPTPPSGGALLQPRIFTTQFTIPVKTYTYDALAQILTDRINKIPTTVSGQSNDPFPADGGTPTPANIRGFSNSRFLTSTADLSMQQADEDTIAGRLPFFPSRFQYTNEDPPTELLQPIWVSTDGTKGFQYDESSLNGFDAPRWCGAESVSFLYDQTSDTFQIAQAHSNIYSRLDGGIIARQFRSNYGTGDDVTFRDGDLVTCDKAGGVFFTSLEPTSLWFDKMKFNPQKLLVQQLGNNPALVNLATGDIDPTLNPANGMLANSLTHTLGLTEGEQITGNFLGTALNIDKRVRTFDNPAPPTPPTVTFSGGKYQECEPTWELDVATDTPVTIPGKTVTPDQVTDPFFQIEISGMNRQNIVGATQKNNLIQSIVGKYFTNGGFTSGNIDDGFRYTHLGEPMMLRSLSVRILDSDGKPAQGLGPNSAVILELDTDK